MIHLVLWVCAVFIVQLILSSIRREPGEGTSGRGRLWRRRSNPEETRVPLGSRVRGSLLLGTGLWMVIESGVLRNAFPLNSWIAASGWRDFFAQPMCLFSMGLVLAAGGVGFLMDRGERPPTAPRGRPLNLPDLKTRSTPSSPHHERKKR